jgi:purine-cytosine permease-like protein
VLPGPLAHRACGLAGLLCVVIAGWTTASPTLYRAGLAFQAILPSSSRFKVTLITGLVASVTAVFPVVTMQLLDFVALWGMILMPMGAVIFVDFWILPRLGLRSNFAESSRRGFNWAAAAAWLASVAFSVCVVATLGRDKLFFVSLPGWFVAVVLYLVLSKVMQGTSSTAQAQPAR